MQSWQETFGALKEKYLKRSSDRLAEILEVLDGLISNPRDEELIRKMSRSFHWLAGSGSMYGFKDVSELGARGEQYLENVLKMGDRGGVDVDFLKGLVSDLSNAFIIDTDKDGSPETSNLGAAIPKEADDRSIVILSEDKDSVASIAKIVDELGMTVIYSRDIKSAMAELDRRMPEGVIIEIPIRDGDAYNLVEKIRGMQDGDKPAIFIVSKQTGFLDKVRSIHCGADAHYEKPIDLKAMSRRLRYLLDKTSMTPPKILSVEDDPDQAAFIRAFLESVGYQVKTCTDPKNFDSFMAEFKPDLVILDVMLPGVTGYELARYIRQDERHATLPVIFLTTHGQLDARIESTRSGGDDHLVKPVPPALLLNSVSSKLERARYLNTLLHKDGLTNLLNHTAFMEQAQQVVAQKKRNSEHVALIVLDVDYFSSINERHGYTGGDKVLLSLSLLLQKRLRQSDIIGRLSGDEFGIIAEDLDEKEALSLASRLIADFASIQHTTLSHSGFNVTCSAGLAMLDANDMSLEQWTGSAYAALAQAKADGKNCAVIYKTRKDIDIALK
ncbi:MAG: diguanylate cyclase [Cyanobacteriota/Melainabacteria group bacterium]|nr:diguanylate cyclase [Cyanobacteria bacterium HKST-UBA01]MCB9468445.1 diguanylate cyclase [Candidatus Obscuribacterales bacterium]